MIGQQIADRKPDLSPRADTAQSPQFKLDEFLPYRINWLAMLVSQALSRIYTDRYKIGVAEWRVIVNLGQHGVMTGKAISAASQMHKTKVSRAVAFLERRKLVSRRANRADMRETFLSLTPAGRKIYDELVPEAMEFAQRLLDVVEPNDRAALDRALTQLTVRSNQLVAEIAKKRSHD